MESEIEHLVRVGSEAANAKLFHWFDYAETQFPAQAFTHRILKMTEIWQRMIPLFADIC